MQSTDEASPSAVPVALHGPQRGRRCAPSPASQPPLSPKSEGPPPTAATLHPAPLLLPLYPGFSAGLRPGLVGPFAPTGPAFGPMARRGGGGLNPDTEGFHLGAAQPLELDLWSHAAESSTAPLSQAEVQHRERNSVWGTALRTSAWDPSIPRGDPTSPGPESWLGKQAGQAASKTKGESAWAPCSEEEDAAEEGGVLKKSRSTKGERCAPSAFPDPAPSTGMKRSATFSSLDALPPRPAAPKHCSGLTDSKRPTRGVPTSMLLRCTADCCALPRGPPHPHLEPAFMGAPSCSSGWASASVTITDCRGEGYVDGLQRDCSESMSLLGALPQAPTEFLRAPCESTCSLNLCEALPLGHASDPAFSLCSPLLEPTLASALHACGRVVGQASGACSAACREGSLEEAQLFSSGSDPGPGEEKIFDEVFVTRLQGSQSVGPDTLAPLRSKVLGTRKGTPGRWYSLP